MSGNDFDAFDPGIPGMVDADPAPPAAGGDQQLGDDQQPQQGHAQAFFAIVSSSAPGRVKFNEVPDLQVFFEAALKIKFDSQQGGNNLDFSTMTVRPYQAGFYVAFPSAIKSALQALGIFTFISANGTSYGCDYREWADNAPGSQLNRGMGMAFLDPISGSPIEAVLKLDLPQIFNKADLVVTDIHLMRNKTSGSYTGKVCVYFSTPSGGRPDVKKLVFLKKRGGFESVGYKFNIKLAVSVLKFFKLCGGCFRPRAECTCISSRSRAGPSRADRLGASRAAWAAAMNMQAP